MKHSSDLQLCELSEVDFATTWKLLKAGVSEGVAAGIVGGIWTRQSPYLIYVGATGERRVAPVSEPMLADTIFDLASVSKVFGTATLAALLVERRWLGWDTPISAIFPAYPHKTILIKHLLSHTAGFPAYLPLWQKLREAFSPHQIPHQIQDIPIADRQKKMREFILNVSPEVAPETRALYSDISFLLLGFALEEVTQMPLDQAVTDLLWKPMGIRQAFYQRIDRNCYQEMNNEIAATEQSDWRGGLLQGQVNDENCWAMGGYAGHAGAFGNVQDLLLFSRQLMEGFLSNETTHAMWSRMTKPAGCERTLGWDTPSGENPAAGSKFSPKSVGHLGFTGTSLWIDPIAGIAVALLTNRTHPNGRENQKIRTFRPRFHDAVRTDLGLA